MLLLSIVSAALLQGPGGLTLNVNDPQSHGVVGDGALSLDEAIRIANGTLATSALSTAEQGQVAGAGTIVATIRVDPAVVPTITLQSPLTDFVGNGMAGPRVAINGMAMGSSLRAVIQGGAHAHVFALRSHTVDLMGLKIVGGQIGVDAAMPMMTGPMMMAMVMRCELENQTAAGIKLHATGSQHSMLMTMHTALRNMPVGFLVDDQSAGGRVMGECEFVTMDGVTLGCEVTENGSGNLSMFMLFRSNFTNGQTLARKRRGATSTQQFMFRFVHIVADCSADVVDIEGVANGLTMIHHHHSDWIAGVGQRAFWVHPRTAQFDVHGSEMRFVGDVEVAGNPFTMRVWQQNNDYENGTVSYDVDGALPNLLWNRYTNCTLTAPPTALSPVVVRQSEFYGTQVNGQSIFAPISLDGCYRSGGSIGGNSSESNPAPSVFLGDTTIAPPDPQLGTAVDLTCDLPFGIGCVWVFSFSYPRPTTTVEPVRHYGDPATAIVLPGMVLFQSTTSVPLPNIPELAEVELYITGITLPLLGQSWVPDYHLPRGELVRPRL